MRVVVRVRLLPSDSDYLFSNVMVGCTLMNLGFLAVGWGSALNLIAMLANAWAAALYRRPLRLVAEPEQPLFP